MLRVSQSYTDDEIARAPLGISRCDGGRHTRGDNAFFWEFPVAFIVTVDVRIIDTLRSDCERTNAEYFHDRFAQRRTDAAAVDGRERSNSRR